MSVSKKIETIIKNASWIRKMFEEGVQLKAKHGAQNVFDLSLGNPNLVPPKRFNEVLDGLAHTYITGQHAYMPNAGYDMVRQAVAQFVSSEQGMSVAKENVIMTCGAAGALNVIFKTILDPGGEVVVPAPYFVEYGFYVDNHGGVLKSVPTGPEFELDLRAIREAINKNTKAILINSPNNPSGQIYSNESIRQLGHILREESENMGQTIYLISDEPYRKIAFDSNVVPPIFSYYENSVIATSYSKDLSIPGERIGFLAISPHAQYKTELIAGMTLANRILGFVNAPAFMQRAVAALQGLSVDPGLYQQKRDLLCQGLKTCGYDFVTPKGAFYLFPKSPIADDVAFVRALQEEKILTVPGTGFGCPGFFRIAFCVENETIEKALPHFANVRRQFAAA